MSALYRLDDCPAHGRTTFMSGECLECLFGDASDEALTPLYHGDWPERDDEQS